VQAHQTDVVIIGAGASGTMAAIQASRSGAKVVLLEETPWAGGMLTSAGVSAIDGNYKLPSGLWQEFRLALETHYGGAEELKTGWVSHVLFEPQVAASILRRMLDSAGVDLRFNTLVKSIRKKDGQWHVKTKSNETFVAQILIDATELGDILANLKIPYDIGMDSRYNTGEEIAPKDGNTIIQDLTYVAVLKDYGPKADKTIPKPKNYDPNLFLCACAGVCDQDTMSRTLWSCDRMITYGKLPNNLYMVNWPIYGNDFYVNMIEASPKKRKKMLKRAKEHTLAFVYYIQHNLGFKNLGLAEDLFPTKDHLPFLPYHRESRRMRGKVRFDLNDLSKPYEQNEALYRTGIAVGDYPVDHHHAAYPDHSQLPDLHFYPVPSYSLPLGTLIPEKEKNFIVAEKSISVTNLVNGTTRLQPVCMLVGQAAGALAALAIRHHLSPDEVEIRDVQEELLEAKAFLMPYQDIATDDSAFKAIQRIGATGILRGKGETIGWENVTRFFPDSLVDANEISNHLKDFGITLAPKDEELSYLDAMELVQELNGEIYQLSFSESLRQAGLSGLQDPKDKITRRNMAILLDILADPFHTFPVNHKGQLSRKKQDR
jgi:hypothetical protein